MNTIKTPKPLWKRIARKIHLWLGLTVIIPLLVVTITGTILTGILLTNETKHKFSSTQNYIITPIEIGQIVNISNNYEKDGFRSNVIRIPEKIDSEITIHFANSQNSNIMRMMLEPVTLRIIKIEQGNSLEKIILNLHSNFLINGGKTFVGFIGITLCIMCISGVVAWIPRRNNIKNSSVPKFSLRGRALYINLHKSFGVWCAIFIITIGFTGTYLVFPQKFQYVVSHFSYVRDFKKLPKQNDYRHSNNIETITARVIKSIPKYYGIISIQIPQKPYDAYRFILRPENYLSGQHGISVFTDNLGNILEIRDPNQYSRGEKFIMWLGLIHKGHGFGILWRLLQIFFGTTILLFIVTGLLIWLKKKRT